MNLRRDHQQISYEGRELSCPDYFLVLFVHCLISAYIIYV